MHKTALSRLFKSLARERARHRHVQVRAHRRAVAAADRRLIGFTADLVSERTSNPTLADTCPWRIRKLRRDRHLEKTVTMVPARVVVKCGMGGFAEATSTQANSLGRHDAEILGGNCKPRALIFDRGNEF